MTNRTWSTRIKPTKQVNIHEAKTHLSALISDVADGESVILAIAALPEIHRDPFDRIMIAQAQVENMTIVTSGRHIARYNVLVHDARA